MRGRQPNLQRAAAREAGEKVYVADHDCDFCGTNVRYVSNASCVSCANARGRARYAGQDEAARLAQRARDQARHNANKVAE